MFVNANISSSVVMENGTASPYQSAMRPWQKQMLTPSLSVIIILALFGNLIVVAVFCTHNPLRKVTNSFLVSLAVSDMLVGAVNMPIWILNIVCDCKMVSEIKTTFPSCNLGHIGTLGRIEFFIWVTESSLMESCLEE